MNTEQTTKPALIPPLPAPTGSVIGMKKLRRVANRWNRLQSLANKWEIDRGLPHNGLNADLRVARTIRIRADRLEDQMNAMGINVCQFLRGRGKQLAIDEWA